MRLVVQFSNKSYTNINADRLEREESFVLAYRQNTYQLRADEELCAIIDLASIDYLYLSEEKGEANKTRE